MFKKIIQNLKKKIIGTKQTLKINMFNTYKLSNLNYDIDNLTIDVYLNIQKEDEIKNFVTNFLNNLPITLQVLQINFNIATHYFLNEEIILGIIKENIKIPFNCILMNTVNVYNSDIKKAYEKLYGTKNNIHYKRACLYKLWHQYHYVIDNAKNIYL